MKRPQLDPESIALFREAMRDVTPLGRAPTVPEKRRLFRRPKVARGRVIEYSPAEVAVDPVGQGDALSYRRDGVQDSVMRRLRRGQQYVEAELDLHGLTALAAEESLRQFLSEALVHRLRCIRVIHGKGLGSPNPWPVLKNTVNSFLRRTPAVIAYVSARPEDGGTGAVVVLLTAGRPKNL